MGIHLYRQLDVSIAEIRNLMTATSLTAVSENFSYLALHTENEIERLQKRLEKLRFMKQHLDNLIDGQTHCCIKDLQFAIREPMMKFCPWYDKADSFPRIEGCRCIYSVVKAPIYSELHWHLDDMISYAKEHELSYSSNAHAFYVFSIVPEDTVIDYYEVYLPILD